MKFIDLMTGAKLEADNEFVIDQYKKHTDRYKEVKTETKPKEEKK